MSAHAGRNRGASRAPFVIVVAILGATSAAAQNRFGFARDGTDKAFAPADAAPALPDPTMTPGAADPAVGLDRICTETTRHRRLASTRLCDAVFAAYSIPPGDRYLYECDHLVPVALGGLTVAANLWPQIQPRGRAQGPPGGRDSAARVRRLPHAPAGQGRRGAGAGEA